MLLGSCRVQQFPRVSFCLLQTARRQFSLTLKVWLLLGPPGLGRTGIFSGRRRILTVLLEGSRLDEFLRHGLSLLYKARRHFSSILRARTWGENPQDSGELKNFTVIKRLPFLPSQKVFFRREFIFFGSIRIGGSKEVLDCFATLSIALTCHKSSTLPLGGEMESGKEAIGFPDRVLGLRDSEIIRYAENIHVDIKK